MKIAIIGSKGFIGSNLTRYLRNKGHFVFEINRSTLDVLNSTAVRSLLAANLFEVVINCAAKMTDNNSLHDARNNFGMFMNFYDNRELFGKFINTASGAEFDRTLDINKADESLIFDRMPQDSYGWGQNMKSRICATTDRFYNLRIFNCFGSGESETRIFPKFITQQTQKEFVIDNDRQFDYFGIEDLCCVVDRYISTSDLPSDINCVYNEKYLISEVISKFCHLHNLKNNIRVNSISSNNYTGSSTKLENLNIKLLGLNKSLKNYFIRI